LLGTRVKLVSSIKSESLKSSILIGPVETSRIKSSKIILCSFVNPFTQDTFDPFTFK
jgi:hypothetical protein